MEYPKCNSHQRISYITCLEVECKREMLCHFCIKEKHAEHRTVVLEDFLKELDKKIPIKKTFWEKD